MPNDLLNPAKSWTGTADFKEEVSKLGALFVENFKKYEDEATEGVIKAGRCNLLTLSMYVVNVLQQVPQSKQSGGY